MADVDSHSCGKASLPRLFGGPEFCFVMRCLSSDNLTVHELSDCLTLFEQHTAKMSFNQYVHATDQRKYEIICFIEALISLISKKLKRLPCYCSPVSMFSTPEIKELLQACEAATAHLLLFWENFNALKLDERVLPFGRNPHQINMITIYEELLEGHSRIDTGEMISDISTLSPPAKFSLNLWLRKVYIQQLETLRLSLKAVTSLRLLICPTVDLKLVVDRLHLLLIRLISNHITTVIHTVTEVNTTSDRVTFPANLIMEKNYPATLQSFKIALQILLQSALSLNSSTTRDSIEFMIYNEYLNIILILIHVTLPVVIDMTWCQETARQTLLCGAAPLFRYVASEDLCGSWDYTPIHVTIEGGLALIHKILMEIRSRMPAANHHDRENISSAYSLYISDPALNFDCKLWICCKLYLARLLKKAPEAYYMHAISLCRAIIQHLYELGRLSGSERAQQLRFYKKTLDQESLEFWESLCLS